MSIEVLTLLFFASLVLFLVLGLPLSFVLGGISVVFIYFTWGPQGLLYGGCPDLGRHEQIYSCCGSPFYFYGHDTGKVGRRQ